MNASLSLISLQIGLFFSVVQLTVCCKPKKQFYRTIGWLCLLSRDPFLFYNCSCSPLRSRLSRTLALKRNVSANRGQKKVLNCSSASSSLVQFNCTGLLLGLVFLLEFNKNLSWAFYGHFVRREEREREKKLKKIKKRARDKDIEFKVSNRSSGSSGKKFFDTSGGFART